MSGPATLGVLRITSAFPQIIPDDQNNGNGCFGVTVDFSGPAPIIYATTTKGWGNVNSNVVRIVDTNASAIETTIAQANSKNMAYRGIEFTPEVQPTTAVK
jgi:hypothetical protein